MKKIIFDYLKTYGFDLQKILESNNKSGKDYFKRPTDTFMDKYRVNFTIESKEDGIDIYISSSPELSDLSVFHEFSKGLIEIINQNSEKKVEKSELNESWFGWESKDFPISFGVKDEFFQFNSRITINK